MDKGRRGKEDGVFAKSSKQATTPIIWIVRLGFESYIHLYFQTMHTFDFI